MGLEFAPRRIEYSSRGKAEADIIRAPESGSIDELITENERLQLVIVELLIKNEYLRARLQHEKSI
jgi:hypothetical protein